MEPIKKEYIERHETAKAMISAMKGVISPYDVVSVAEVLRDQPAADVVAVVRCRSCAVPHNRWTGCPKLGGLVTDENFFCAFAEQKEVVV